MMACMQPCACERFSITSWYATGACVCMHAPVHASVHVRQSAETASIISEFEQPEHTPSSSTCSYAGSHQHRALPHHSRCAHLASDVLPTPGGPMKHRMGALAPEPR